MKTTAFAEYRLSHLMLGTVQFGKQYGIANTKGQPSYEDVRLFIIIRAANSAGVAPLS